jgi:hypothetical protein
MDKLSIHFTKGVSGGTRGEIMDLLDVYKEALIEKYLGMPTNVGSLSNGEFRYLKDRVWKRVQGWMEQALSASSKEVLIKAVAQAVLTIWPASGCREACGSILMGYSGASNGEARRVRGGQHAG